MISPKEVKQRTSVHPENCTGVGFKTYVLGYKGKSPDFFPPQKKMPRQAFVCGRALVTIYGCRPT